MKSVSLLRQEGEQNYYNIISRTRLYAETVGSYQNGKYCKNLLSDMKRKTNDKQAYLRTF